MTGLPKTLPVRCQRCGETWANVSTTQAKPPVICATQARCLGRNDGERKDCEREAVFEVQRMMWALHGTPPHMFTF